jgi:segregation and condensation protein A
LYIPPDALEIILEVFEGPLDLLLYLIRKHNLNILDVSVAKITHQYLEYIDLMIQNKFELAAEYLEMAALLTEIKSKMLLPKNESEVDENEEDPRVALVKKLKEYEQIKQASINLDKIPRAERDFNNALVGFEEIKKQKILPKVEINDLLSILQSILRRENLRGAHNIGAEGLSVREKMSKILTFFSEHNSENFVDAMSFYTASEGRLGLIVTFLAILELAKEGLIEIVQNNSYQTIYVRNTC